MLLLLVSRSLGNLAPMIGVVIIAPKCNYNGDSQSVMVGGVQYPVDTTVLLEIHYKKRFVLPYDFGSLTALRTLVMIGNKLTTLPNNFGNLTALKSLRLIGNQLTTLPHYFGNLTAIDELDLEGNKLTTLPHSFGNLMALKSVKLIDNQLKTLPHSFKTKTS